MSNPHSRNYTMSLTDGHSVVTTSLMVITYDPTKRAKTLQERNLDFEDAALVFAGRSLTAEDNRHDYGEVRYSTVGRLRGRMVLVIWTPRGEARHVISMRKTNGKETRRFAEALG